MSTTFDLTQFLAQNGALGGAILLFWLLFGKPQMAALDRLNTSIYDLSDDIRELLGLAKRNRPSKGSGE
jgi:hypothetical protein